ncbi:hypothetical protein RIF29_33247 [Crotalaria pallida]|uniref:Uncharacterized protein n=1 Tax=Crotalaria pallida TaxID=3830 RepID=A0AAN9HTY9_CROPI
MVLCRRPTSLSSIAVPSSGEMASFVSQHCKGEALVSQIYCSQQPASHQTLIPSSLRLSRSSAAPTAHRQPEAALPTASPEPLPSGSLPLPFCSLSRLPPVRLLSFFLPLLLSLRFSLSVVALPPVLLLRPSPSPSPLLSSPSIAVSPPPLSSPSIVVSLPPPVAVSQGLASQ